MDQMLCGGFTIKNEPIKAENADFLQNVVIKCENDYFAHPSEYSNHKNVRTTICSESEYLADGNVPFESVIVKEEPKLNDHLTYVVTSVDASNLECYICRNVSINITDLLRHIRTHTKPIEPGFDLKSLMKRDVDRRKVVQHERRFACKQCDKKFASSSGLYNHRSVHEETLTEKMFVCDYCDRKCLRKSSLRQHMYIHISIKRFECNECDRKFTDSSTLYKHKQTHSGLRPFACNLCDRRCARKATLARHLKTHTGEKSFVCDLCDKKFSRNSTLNHHKMIHSGEPCNPWPCYQCDRKFKIKSTLDYHVKTHLGLKPFGCDECKRHFMTQINLNQHKRNFHKHRPTARYKLPVVGDMPAENKNKGNKTNRKKSKKVSLMSKCKALRKI